MEGKMEGKWRRENGGGKMEGKMDTHFYLLSFVLFDG